MAGNPKWLRRRDPLDVLAACIGAGLFGVLVLLGLAVTASALGVL